MQRRGLVLLIACLLAALAVVHGKAPEGTERPGSALSADAAGAPDEGPVPVPEASETAMRYYRSGNWLWGLNLVWGLLVPAVILFSGFSARLRDLARRIAPPWLTTTLLYLAFYLVIDFIVNLPLAYYQGFVRQHAYGLSNQDFSKWMGDSFKGLVVSLIAVVLVGWGPYLLARKSPRRWWLYTGLVAIPFIFLTVLITPIWVSPLFNDFGPMQDKTLEADILALAERAGIEGGRVFEVNKSVDTEAVNAYVTGFLDTKRIVLWDTIIAKLDRDELLFVMGHEMGHYVLKHVISTIFFLSAVFLLALYAIYRTAGFLIGRYRGRFGFDEISDVASLPLVLILLNVYFLILTPVVLGYSRGHEHEADRFGLELLQDNHAAASAFVKLQHENLGNPWPGTLYKLWRAGHPTLGDRITFCNRYRPWESGGELRYADRFEEKE